MGNLIAWLSDNFLELMPFEIVFSYDLGVRWTLGCNPKQLDPGFHWKIWFIHEIETINVQDDFFDLPVQTVTTKDGKPFTFSATIGFRIVDVVKHFCNVTDFKEASISIAMAHLAKRVREKTSDELTSDIGDLETSCKGTLTTRVKDWGTEIFSVGFVNFVHVPRQLRLWGGLNVTE